jgi:FkbM family methyltransferase
MGVIQIGVNANGRSYSMAMDLDYEIPTEKLIRDYLARGMFYEPDTSATILRLVGTGDVVFDVGAHVGFFSLLMGLLVGPRGRVISVEPGSNNLPRLKANIGLSKLENITIVDKPATSTPEDVTFFLSGDCGGWNALWDMTNQPASALNQASPKVITMRATTLDGEIERLGLPVPKLIKIDVEGCERRVLEGARKLLTGCKVPYIIAELHEFALAKMGSSQMDLRRFMEGFGYQTFAMYNTGGLPKLIPPGTQIRSAAIINILFSTVDCVGRVWDSDWVDPTICPLPSAMGA